MFKKSFLLAVVILVALFAFGCDGDGGNPNSPTGAYKGLYAAVKAKNPEEIKKWLSKSTLGFAEMAAKQQNSSIDEVVKNGFTATTFAAKLPDIRDERVNENMGNVEVWNAKDKRWEDLPFIKEETGWKLAIGDVFAGTHVSPGQGTAARQAEEANKMSGNNFVEAPAAPNSNVNLNMKRTQMPPVNGQKMPMNGQKMPPMPTAPQNANVANTAPPKKP